MLAIALTGCATLPPPIPHPGNGQTFGTEQEKASYCRELGGDARDAYYMAQRFAHDSEAEKEAEQKADPWGESNGTDTTPLVYLVDTGYLHKNGEPINDDAETDILIDAVNYAYSGATDPRDAFMFAWRECMTDYGGY